MSGYLRPALSKSVRWIIAAIGIVALVAVYGVWKTIDQKTGGGFLSGALRGALVFCGIGLLWAWAKRGDGTKSGSVLEEVPKVAVAGEVSAPARGEVVDQATVPISTHPSVQPEQAARDSLPEHDKIYALIAEELDSGEIDKGLWTRLYAETGGNENRTKARYIKQRVERLIAVQSESIEKAGSGILVEVTKPEELRLPEKDIEPICPEEQHKASSIELKLIDETERQHTEACSASKENASPMFAPITFEGIPNVEAKVVSSNLSEPQPDSGQQKTLTHRFFRPVIGVALLLTAGVVALVITNTKISRNDGREVQTSSHLEKQPTSPVPQKSEIDSNGAKQSSSNEKESTKLTGILAVDEAIRAAETGLPIFQFQLATMYEFGLIGLAQNEHEAAKWYRKAADQGQVQAQTSLGFMYESGRGGLVKSNVKAANWYRKAATKGEVLAQTNLGTLYELGGEGLSKDEKQAEMWYRKAADQGFAKGQFYLGRMYAHGRGLAKNDHEAVKWYRKAADQGLIDAQTSLGLMYESGRGGLVKSNVEAARWYKKAAAKGNPQAQTNLGFLYGLGGGGVTKDEKQAESLLRKAADQGFARGQLSLGIMYQYGLGGLAKDEGEAVRLYQLAAAQGLLDAKERLAVLQKQP